MNGIHGGIDPWAMKEAGIDPEDIRDFSVSINPAPLPDSVRDIIGHSALYRYPDSRSRALVDALSRRYGTSPEEILIVNGTSQAIFLLAGAFLSPGDVSLVAGPAYGEYRDASEAVGGRVVEYRAAENRLFRPDCDEIAGIIAAKKPKLFWICSPNNPTGAWLTAVELKVLAAASEENGCLMVLDEAYRCFAPPGMLPEDFQPGVVHLHSMTKDFCIPGLRLGWLRAEADVVRALMRRQPDWSVSAPAQDAGTACLDRLPYFEKSWAETRNLTTHLIDGLESLGLTPFPTAANFVLVRIGDDAAVKRLAAGLWEKLMMVRDCASFGLEGCIRIGARSREDNDALIDAMRTALE